MENNDKLNTSTFMTEKSLNSKKGLFLCLRLVFNVTDSTISRTTGYSYAVRDLACGLVKKGLSVDCYSVNDEPELKEWNGIRLISRKWMDCIRHFRLSYLFKGIKFANSLSVGFKEFLRIIYYFLFGGLVEHIIKQNEYDIISIQGFNRYSYPFVIACERMNVKYSVSFHALDCFEESYKDKDSDFIRSMILHFVEKNVSVSFLSKRMREKALDVIPDNFRSKVGDAFKSIYNGFSIIEKSDINPEWLQIIPTSAKVLLCVGNVNTRKNQIQVVRCLPLVESNKASDIHIIIIGQILENEIAVEVSRSPFKDRIHLTGSIPHNALYHFYDRADFIVLPSLSEGFGLSIIESFSFGKPVLMWDDLDVASEINDSRAVLLINGHTDEALAQGISEMITKEWDENEIKEIAEKFSMNNMIENYYNWFLSQDNSMRVV